MIVFSKLPSRQKYYLLIVALTGAFITVSFYWSLIKWEQLHTLILFYGILVPVFLLAGETLIDLDNKNIFKMWSVFASILFAVYIFTRNIGFVYEKAIDLNEATNSFKALAIFLAAYWVLNKIVKKKTGLHIINTFSTTTVYNYTAKRNIRWFDIVTNIILLIITIFGGIIKF